MKKKNKNTIQLPTSRGVARPQTLPGGPPVIGQTPQKDSPQMVLKRIADNRKSGLAGLENKVDRFGDERPISYEPHIEDRFRDVENALKATYTNLEALNAMVDMITHDLIGSIQNMERNSVAQFQASAHLQVLLEALKRSGTVTDEELRNLWEEIIVKPSRESSKTEEPSDPED